MFQKSWQFIHIRNTWNLFEKQDGKVGLLGRWLENLEVPYACTQLRIGNAALNKSRLSGVEGKGWLKPKHILVLAIAQDWELNRDWCYVHFQEWFGYVWVWGPSRWQLSLLGVCAGGRQNFAQHFVQNEKLFDISWCRLCTKLQLQHAFPHCLFVTSFHRWVPKLSLNISWG